MSNNGLLTTFVPNVVRMVYLMNKTYETKTEKIFAFVNNNDNINLNGKLKSVPLNTKTEKTFAFVNNNDNINLNGKLKSVPFKISSVKNNNGCFFLYQ